MKRLFLPIVFALILSISFTAFSGQQDMESSLREIELFVYNVENHFENLYSLLNVMGKTKEVASGKWEEMEGLFESVQNENPDVLFWYSNPDGSYYTVEKGLTGVSLAQREYFQKLQNGSEVYCEFVVGLTSGKKSAVVAIPIFEGEKLAGAVGGSYFIENLYDFINGFYFKNRNVSYLILDVNGNELLKHNVPESTEKTLLNMMGQMEYGMYPFSDSQKSEYSYLFGPSPNTGWKYALGFGE